MSSLLTTLAMRGAGLTLPGKIVLTPRGRARFEALAGFAEVGTDGLSVEAAPDAVIAAPRRLDGDSLLPSQLSTMPGHPIEPTPPVPTMAAEPAAASAALTATQLLPTPETGIVGAPKPVVSAMADRPASPGEQKPGPPADLSATQPSSAPESGIVSAPKPVVSAMADRPASPGEEKPQPPAVVARVPAVAQIDPIQMVLDHLAASRDSEHPAPELQGPSPEQQPSSGSDLATIDAPSTPPGVTVSIDRIQVIIEPPPRPAAQQRRTIQPLGFAAYARARRGVPR
jgi:hypothetical protein